MKTKELFGIQFAQKSHYKAQLLGNFKAWKREKQATLDQQDKKTQVILSRYIRRYENDTFVGVGITFEDLQEEIRKELQQDILKKGWERLFEEEVGRNLLARRFCYISRSEVEELFIEPDCQHYFITETALQECRRIRVTEPLDLEWLEPTPDGKRQLNFGDQFIRYQKKGPKIVALAASFTPRQGASYMQHTFFHFDLARKKESLILLDDHLNEFYDRISPRDFDRKSHTLLFQLIAFMELAPKEHVFLPARDKYTSPSSSFRLKNQESFPITIVNCSWNRSVHYGIIDVGAHFKKQPCGPKNAHRKRILVLHYTRDGYNLKVQKLQGAQT